MIKTVTTTKYFGEDGLRFTLHPIEETLSVRKTKKGYEAKYLVQDEEGREIDNDDDALFMVNFHRDFWLEKKGIIPEEDVATFYRGGKIAQENDYFIFPMSCFIHSGVLLSLNPCFEFDSQGWDTSHVGLVLASKKEFKTEAQARKAVESLISETNKILSGEVYAIVKDIYDKNKKLIDNETIWGLVGFEYAKEELKEL